MIRTEVGDNNEKIRKCRRNARRQPAKVGFYRLLHKHIIYFNVLTCLQILFFKW